MKTLTALALIAGCLLLFSERLLAQDTVFVPQAEPSHVNSGLQLFGGLGVPLGNFAESDGGGAKTGYGAGAQYTVSLGELLPNAGIVLCGLYTSNATDVSALSGFGLSVESGSYSNIWAMGGAKVTIPAAESFSIDLAFLVGADFGTSPSVTASGQGIRVSMSSASATAFAVAVGGDVVLGKHFTFGLRYFDAKPKYKVTATGEGPGVPIMTITDEVEQSTGILLVSVGYLF